MYPQQIPRCPGFTPPCAEPQPCGAPLRGRKDLCDGCVRKEQSWQAGLEEWVSLGLREFSEYLSRCDKVRAFERWHPPV